MYGVYGKSTVNSIIVMLKVNVKRNVAACNEMLKKNKKNISLII